MLKSKISSFMFITAVVGLLLSSQAHADQPPEDGSLDTGSVGVTGVFAPSGPPSQPPRRIDAGSNCIVDLVQDYDVSGTLSGQFQIDYRIRVAGPCGKPIGTFEEDWIAHGTFTGRVDKRDTTLSFTYVAHVSAGGEVDGTIDFGPDILGKINVSGNFADGRLSYQGQLPSEDR